MRNLVVCNAMSLDGYYAGPNNDVALLELDSAFDAYNAERLRGADTLLLGRNSFDGFKSFWPSVADDPDPQWTDAEREVSRLNNAIGKVVVSDSLTPEQSEPWRRTTLIVRRADAHEQIAELKRQAGKDILVFGSHTLWTDLMAHGLVDELHLMVGSVVVGGGRPMFETPVGSAYRPDQAFANRLRLLDSRTWEGSGNVLVRYAVIRVRQEASVSIE
jgi:dihydrofolate reductase